MSANHIIPELKAFKIDPASYVPKYCQLKELLRVIIKKMKPGEIIPSEQRLAEHFNVHRLTVRRAMKALDAEGALRRVPGSGTFIADKPSDPPANQIACFFRKLRPLTDSDNFFLEIFEAFEEELARNNHQLLYKSLAGLRSDNDIVSAAAELAGPKTAGFALDELVSDNALRQIAKLDTPIVLINRTTAVKNIRSVVSDCASTVSTILDLLLRAGHRRILFLYETADPNQLDMLKELKTQIPAHGLASPDDILVVPAHETGFSGEPYREATHIGLKAHNPTAIITALDWIANNVYLELKSKGIRIPDDISVASVGGLDLSAPLDPPLTTVKMDTALIGKTAAQTVMAPSQTVQKNILITTSLIRRTSCAAISDLGK